MAKSKRRAAKRFSKKSFKKSPPPKKRKFNWWWIGIISVIFVFVGILMFTGNFGAKPKRIDSKSFGPRFKKGGELTFFNKDNKEKIITINIEISEDDFERARGLMYRRKMEETQGMFFIMEDERLQSFWMKNTFISLDIIYLDNDLTIVKIQKYTQPFSEAPIPSFKNAKYVIEVIAGFCDKYKIEEGDHIDFKRE